ncbi:Glutamate-cysteine ligase, partial [Smittium mucronatum]
MGLLTIGTSLDWADAKEYCSHVRMNGIQQFLNIWRKCKNKDRDVFLWGDEIEYIIVEFEVDVSKVRLFVFADKAIEKLNVNEKSYLESQLLGIDALAANIRERRGSKVEINIPIFHDVNTPIPFIDPSITWDRELFPGDSEAKNGAAKPNHIYMDATGFGMGCCCLQVTFQASDLNEARRMYDQLAPITAIAMALSASTPILRGYLADTDCRWNIISSSVDDRTPEERGLKPLSGDFKRILKSRYGTIDSYLGSNDGFFREEFNDIDLVY